MTAGADSTDDAGVDPDLLADFVGPPPDCALCPRLADYRRANRAANPDWFNAPVPSFGTIESRLLVVGMAPGVRGANRTGIPFTGDHAGMLLYTTLLRFGLAEGRYLPEPSNPIVLRDCRIANAVRCVPPANLPEPKEVATCNGFLKNELQAMGRLRAVLALGVLAHAAVLKACGVPPTRVRFRHGDIHLLPDGLLLADSYHVSRYNTNTGRLTEAMFHQVVEGLLRRLDGDELEAGNPDAALGQDDPKHTKFGFSQPSLP
jgi:uracil-DNA glycosylase family 4